VWEMSGLPTLIKKKFENFTLGIIHEVVHDSTTWSTIAQQHTTVRNCSLKNSIISIEWLFNHTIYDEIEHRMKLFIMSNGKAHAISYKHARIFSI
jgi:hypothetical protein